MRTDPDETPTHERILVVEDDAAIREMLGSTLTREGFEFQEAQDADEARPIITCNRPDLILLDWMLPGMNGVEFAAQVRRDPCTRDIPIIMVTARGTESDRVHGLQSADDYVTKPFSCRELLARIRTVMRRAAMANHGVDRHRDRDGSEVLPLTSGFPAMESRTTGVTPVPGAAKFNVLVVDDEPARRNFLDRQVEQLGCATFSVGNGLLAVRVSLDRPIDAILMKIELPVMDGIEATRWIRAALEDPYRPWIIADAGDSRSWTAHELLGAGINDVLAGPLHASALRIALNRARQALLPVATSETGKSAISPLS